MHKKILYFLFFSSFCFGQSYEELMKYAHYYGKNIDEFKGFINAEPSASHSDAGIQRIVYELYNHHIGIEEHRSNSGKIGEIFVFQINENHVKANYQWKRYFDSMQADESLQFVKAIFDNGIIKENDLSLSEFILLLSSENMNSNASYGVRYRKQNAYYSLFVVKSKLVFTVDDKNF